MKRTSTVIYFESPNSTTLLPWVNNAPDFTGFSEPTLSVLQNSWQAFLDSGQELEVIPDPDPEPSAPEPDWTGLRADLLSSSTVAAWFDTLSAIHREDITAQIQGQDTATLADAVMRVDYDPVKVELNQFLTDRNIGVQLP